MDDRTHARFQAKVSAPDENGCTTWLDKSRVRGYGKFFVAGKTYRAHRWAYENAHGPIPEGLVIDHLCRNRACVNVAHLEAVTQEENVRRGLWATKTHCPSGHPYSPENTYVAKTGWRSCRACRRR